MRETEKPVESISFIVLGEPSPEGSTKAFYIPKLNRTVTTHQNQKSLVAWRNRVATEAQRALTGTQWVNDSLSAYTVNVDFVLSRPASVQVHRRLHPIIKPDIDKLARAINDALTGILFYDDSQVVTICCSKDYDDERRPGAHITVSRFINCTEKKKTTRKSKEVVASVVPCDDPRDD
jgi:Holliday junction resolvase RusA-like endonuclease